MDIKKSNGCVIYHIKHKRIIYRASACGKLWAAGSDFAVNYILATTGAEQRERAPARWPANVPRSSRDETSKNGPVPRAPAINPNGFHPKVRRVITSYSPRI